MIKEDFRGDDFKKPLQSDFPHQAVITITIECARFFSRQVNFDGSKPTFRYKNLKSVLENKMS